MRFCAAFSALGDKFHYRANKTSPRTSCGVFAVVSSHSLRDFLLMTQFLVPTIRLSPLKKPDNGCKRFFLLDYLRLV